MKDWRVNSVGWSICRLYNFALSTNSQIWQVIGGHIQSIGCVLDPYRYRLAIVSQKLIGNTAFRTENSCLLFVASPTATAQIFEPSFGGPIVYASTALTRQAVDGKTIGTLAITGSSGNVRNLSIPRTATSYQVSKRRFVFVQKSLVSGAIGYPTRRYLTAFVSETTDVLMVRV